MASVGASCLAHMICLQLAKGDWGAPNAALPFIY